MGANGNRSGAGRDGSIWPSGSKLRRSGPDARGEERHALAETLHDDVLQMLAALLVQLRVARSTPDEVLRDARLQIVRDGLAQTMDAVAWVIQALGPGPVVPSPPGVIGRAQPHRDRPDRAVEDDL